MTSSPTLQGITVVPGLGYGAVHVIGSTPHGGAVWTVPEEEIPREIDRLASAISVAVGRLARDQARVAEEVGERDAQIFDVQRAILQDRGALARVESAIADRRVNAEKAVQEVIDHYAQLLGEADRERNYASDVSDVFRRVLDALLNIDRDEIEASDEKLVLAAEELTPQVATYLPRGRVMGIITSTGGRFSHGAVLARSMGVPTVTGVTGLLEKLEQGVFALVDGTKGSVQLRPHEEEVEAFLERRRSLVAQKAALERYADKPAITPDGARLEVQVNIESILEIPTFEISHTDGVGLMRTEFLYMQESEFPSEEEQYQLYRKILEQMAPRPVTLRTLDIGADKQLPYFKTPQEKNPVLGWRGIRITLEWQDLMRVQLGAMLRASVHGNLRILLPMVTSVDEILQANEIFDGVRASLEARAIPVAPDIPLGIMIEVPAALVALSHMIEHVDFLSVGTNDLVQYLLACDRDNPLVARLYDPYHPAIALALQEVALKAGAAGKPCSVCGDLAGDAASALVLLGMGYDSVSVASGFIPEIKYAVRQTSLERAREYATDLLSQSTSRNIRRVLARVRHDLYSRGAGTDSPGRESAPSGFGQVEGGLESDSG